MKIGGQVFFCVIETDINSVINRDVNGWYFDNIDKANDLAYRMQNANPELRFIVMTMTKGK